MKNKTISVLLLGTLLCFLSLVTLSGCKPSERYVPKPADPDADMEFKTTESGLKYRILREYEGKPVKPGDKVAMMMRGSLDDGYVFDTTYHDGHLMHVDYNSLIIGMREALSLIGKGGMIEFIVPPKLGYGERGQGPIPPNAALTFLVEVERIERKKEDLSHRSLADKPLEPDADAPEEFSTTKSGVKYRLRVKTDRIKPTSLDTVSLFFRIRLNDADGEIFNDSYHRKSARHGPLNALPIGIQEGIMQCPVSGSVEFIVPPELLGDRKLTWMAIPNEGKDVLPADTPIHFIAELGRIQYKDVP
ncbi:putative FKBP-type peptidyl-prolyl cis-trans isomerase [Polystyrenella longa]|uniref:Peptidyl-prolyl cis-trans isomerase n=1 Tax=Polystyrenella longa TaxID=2528007 RepID=A0A518CI82_9PLAN|nr:FKBP-type peptidyl-prolyl cis-trans isomerase [Polystyrenella longa]QDU78931.1 putative FKBP-type peptidyl-prolyl cis-trans isomerase [Polystyrenella longa]